MEEEKKLTEREDFLEVINLIIVEEYGEEMTEENLLIDCKIDSYGYAMLWLGLAHSLKKEDLLSPSKKYIDSIDYKTFKVSDLIDEIIRINFEPDCDHE